MNTNRTQLIEQLLQTHFMPTRLELMDESPSHRTGPRSETHFKLILVSNAFKGLSRIKRHQAVYQTLNSLFASGLHALSMHLYTPDEWDAKEQAPALSPACRGGLHEH